MSEDKTPSVAESLAKLREPFPAHQISIKCQPYKKDSTKGKCDKCGGWHGLPAVALSYVGHAALTDRLLDVDPFWSWEPLALDATGLPLVDANGGMWIKLTVCGVTRMGYGDAGGKIGGDATKERIGDALRNSAMRFGAALDLWHKGELHLDEDEKDDKTEADKGKQKPKPLEAKPELWTPKLCEEFEGLLKEIRESYHAMNLFDEFEDFSDKAVLTKQEAKVKPEALLTRMREVGVDKALEAQEFNGGK